MYDVAIIGAGITGTSAAYFLSQYNWKVALLDKENDLANGSTKANSGIVHAGYDPKPGTLMAKYNRIGAKLYEELCPKLSVPYKQIGSLVLAFDDQDMATLQELFARGKANGVERLSLLSPEETLAMEPNLNPEIKGSLYAPEGAVVIPWEMAVALGEVAVKNGVELLLNHQVTGIEKTKTGFRMETTGGTVESRYVINAAGVYADQIHDMAAPHKFDIRASKGQYYILDKNQSDVVSHVIFQCPSKAGKGVLVSPTAHGNLIVGPDARDLTDREDFSTSREALDFVLAQAFRSTSRFSVRESIRNFAGIRPNSDLGDFFIEESPEAPGFIDLSGIKSPGLTAGPAIGQMLPEMLQKAGLAGEKKAAYETERKRIRFRELSPEEKAEVIQHNPLYGRVICRCETVTEGEIVDALHSPIPPTTVDGVKRRCGSGLGRCQGGFCGPRVLELISRELGLKREQVLQDKEGSYILTGETKREAE